MVYLGSHLQYYNFTDKEVTQTYNGILSLVQSKHEKRGVSWIESYVFSWSDS